MPKIKIVRSIEEIIIISAAIIMFATITPFSIYRYLNEQYLVALLEIVSVLIMCSIGAYVWKTRNTQVMSIFTAIFMLAGLVTFNYIIGTSILFWVYPIIMSVYFINSLKVSAAIVTPAIIALLPILIQEKSTIEVISIVVTLIICQLFGYLLSRKIRHQYKIMEELANQDGLTGALNRRAFDERIQFLHNFSFRHKTETEAKASLILFDIDGFKSINDEFGHQEGDRILINLTHLFKNKIRGIDQLYRFGGEEFVVIANGSNAMHASELAEKMRFILESTKISELTTVTASFGVAELHKNEKPNRWIERADKAMYRAKRAGKNRVFIANFDSVNEPKNILNVSHG